MWRYADEEWDRAFSLLFLCRRSAIYGATYLRYAFYNLPLNSSLAMMLRWISEVPS